MSSAVIARSAISIPQRPSFNSNYVVFVHLKTGDLRSRLFEAQI